MILTKGQNTTIWQVKIHRSSTEKPTLTLSVLQQMFLSYLNPLFIYE